MDTLKNMNVYLFNSFSKNVVHPSGRVTTSPYTSAPSKHITYSKASHARRQGNMSSLLFLGLMVPNSPFKRGHNLSSQATSSTVDNDGLVTLTPDNIANVVGEGSSPDSRVNDWVDTTSKAEWTDSDDTQRENEGNFNLI